MFAAIEAKLEQVWHDLTGEARVELERLLADAKAEEAKILPLAAGFEAALKVAVADLAPEVRTALESLAAKLVADLGGLLGAEPSGM